MISQKCYGCDKLMPEQVLKPMVHLRERNSLVVLLCPVCQQRIGDNNPNYYNCEFTSSALAYFQIGKYSEKAANL